MGTIVPTPQNCARDSRWVCPSCPRWGWEAGLGGPGVRACWVPGRLRCSSPARCLSSQRPSSRSPQGPPFQTPNLEGSFVTTSQAHGLAGHPHRPPPHFSCKLPRLSSRFPTAGSPCPLLPVCPQTPAGLERLGLGVPSSRKPPLSSPVLDRCIPLGSLSSHLPPSCSTDTRDSEYFQAHLPLGHL